MKLHLNNQPDCLMIHSCVLDAVEGNADAQNNVERHRIKIADTWYTQSLILTPQAVELWDVNDVSALNLKHFQQLADLNAEVVILGAGRRIAFPHSALTRPLMHKRIGLEVMDTAAACRTYNILAGDGRNAVAALIA